MRGTRKSMSSAICCSWSNSAALHSKPSCSRFLWKQPMMRADPCAPPHHRLACVPCRFLGCRLARACCPAHGLAA